MRKRTKDLVQIVRDNPGCRFTVDNDAWYVTPALPKPESEMTDQDWDDLYERKLACDEDVIARGSGYGSGCCYGGDILQALAEIVGVHIESV